MASIIENKKGRRLIKVSTDDVISLVKAYQNFACESDSYEEIRKKLEKNAIYLPEDLI